MTDLDLLQLLLGTENAAGYGYGALGGRLDNTERAMAAQTEDAHRARRDNLQRLVRQRGGAPSPAAAGYAVPPLADRAAALGLAVRVEEAVAAAYRYALATSPTSEVRQLAVAGLQDAAVRAARWRLLLTPTGAATVAFPGTG